MEESNEGTIWEAALIASDQKLNNLIVLYDNNNFSKKVSSDKKSRKKFQSFGFSTHVVNGHDIKKIKSKILKKIK